MKQLFLSLCLCLGLLPAMAQQKFMDKLVKDVAGQGTVRVVQEAAITRLVNGTMPVEAAADKAEKGKSDGSADGVKQPVRKMKAVGYRIQVYAGGNSRTSRQEAQRMAAKVKHYFDMPTYTHFQSPRWICRVGDFRTYEEASQFLHELRATEQFDEALIVKSVIQIPY